MLTSFKRTFSWLAIGACVLVIVLGLGICRGWPWPVPPGSRIEERPWDTALSDSGALSSEAIGNFTRGKVSGASVSIETAFRPALVYIRGGEFVMGVSPDESDRLEYELQHHVRVASFMMCETEVTQAHFVAVHGKLPAGCPGGCGSTLPASNVSWFDAITYLNDLSAKEGLRQCYVLENDGDVLWDAACDGYRLPSEAEWEYAARAGTTTTYSFGDDRNRAGEFAWHYANAGRKAHSVRTRTGNPWQLYDMHGNVWEWVWDALDEKYGVDLEQLAIDPKGPPGIGIAGVRVTRGGSFDHGVTSMFSWHRDYLDPSKRFRDVGFRCARSVTDKQ